MPCTNLIITLVLEIQHVKRRAFLLLGLIEEYVVPAFSVDCSMDNTKKCMLIFMCACFLEVHTSTYLRVSPL